MASRTRGVTDSITPNSGVRCHQCVDRLLQSFAVQMCFAILLALQTWLEMSCTSVPTGTALIRVDRKRIHWGQNQALEISVLRAAVHGVLMTLMFSSAPFDLGMSREAIAHILVSA
jgi:hypothetical protein